MDKCSGSLGQGLDLCVSELGFGWPRCCSPRNFAELKSQWNVPAAKLPCSSFVFGRRVCCLIATCQGQRARCAAQQRLDGRGTVGDAGLGMPPLEKFISNQLPRAAMSTSMLRKSVLLLVSNVTVVACRFAQFCSRFAEVMLPLPVGQAMAKLRETVSSVTTPHRFAHN